MVFRTRDEEWSRLATVAYLIFDSQFTLIEVVTFTNDNPLTPRQKIDGAKSRCKTLGESHYRPVLPHALKECIDWWIQTFLVDVINHCFINCWRFFISALTRASSGGAISMMERKSFGWWSKNLANDCSPIHLKNVMRKTPRPIVGYKNFISSKIETHIRPDSSVILISIDMFCFLSGWFGLPAARQLLTQYSLLVASHLKE